MSNNKIYSYKASGGGSRLSGRICDADMNGATAQVVRVLKELGLKNMNVSITELKNQKRAMQEWQEDQELNALAESRKDQETVRVDIDSLKERIQ